jgi:hypothetical protein
LYAARNALDERKVSEDPHNNFYACGEFLDKVLDSYLIVGAMKHHGMECMEDTPTKDLYDGSEIDVEKKRMHVHEVIKSFIYRRTCCQSGSRIKHDGASFKYNGMQILWQEICSENGAPKS